MKKLRLKNIYVLVTIMLLIVFGVTLQNLILDTVHSDTNSGQFTHCNNYIIFKQSFFHLVGQKDLYSQYPGEYWDYYKYSPTFALLMAPLAVLPDGLGLLLWNLINALFCSPLYGVYLFWIGINGF